MVVHNMDDPARRVEGGGGWKGNAEVTGVEPQATAGGRRWLRLRIIILEWKLWFRDAFGASRNDPPLVQKKKRHFSYATYFCIIVCFPAAARGELNDALITREILWLLSCERLFESL